MSQEEAEGQAILELIYYDAALQMGETQGCLTADRKKLDKEKLGIQQREAGVEDTWLPKEPGSRRAAGEQESGQAQWIVFLSKGKACLKSHAETQNTAVR